MATGRGRWFGDAHGGHAFEGTIWNLRLAQTTDRLTFHYDYTRGGRCVDGRFGGHILSNGTLSGHWRETLNGSKRMGTAQAMTPIKARSYTHAFEGGYRLTSPIPPAAHDIGVWTIKFKV